MAGYIAIGLLVVAGIVFAFAIGSAASNDYDRYDDPER